MLELLTRSVEKKPRDVKERVRGLVRRFQERRLPKRACVFPRYETAAIQEEFVGRYFAPGGAKARHEAEARIVDLVRFATGRKVDVMV